MNIRHSVKELNKVLNKVRTSPSNLRGFPTSVQEELMGICDSDYKENCRNLTNGHLVTIDSIRDDVYGGYENYADFNFSNLYMPYSTSSILYTNGLIRRITDIKGKSFMPYGSEIINDCYTDEQNDKIAKECERLGIDVLYSDSVITSQVFAGTLLFPIFKGENHQTLNSSLFDLLKAGILKKDCIDYFLNLSRWEVVVAPPGNPTQKEFDDPSSFVVPFLGGRVNSNRCARIIANKSIGYWQKMANLGWGISDFTTYIKSYYAYEKCVNSLDDMVQNMSLLYRKLPIADIYASEASNFANLSTEFVNNLIKKEDDTNNRIKSIITLDTIGDIGCINRDFSDAERILKLKRQDLAAKANVFEPLIWTIEKGNFSSGDDTEGVLLKQYSNSETFYIEIAKQLKNLAKILVINALGTDENVIKYLDYTKVIFNKPIAINNSEKMKIVDDLTKSVLNLVATGMRLDNSIDFVLSVSDYDFKLKKELRKSIEETSKRKILLEELQITSGINNNNNNNTQKNEADEKFEDYEENSRQKIVGNNTGSQRQKRLLGFGTSERNK